MEREFDRLALGERLGSGGAADVFQAFDQERQRQVAVKVLSERAEPSLVARFRREGQILAQLEHPYIVPIHRVGEQHGLRYMVMELMPGGSLKDLLQDGPLAWKRALQIAHEVSQALEYAHAHEIVHRDLKPGNILFDADGCAKLTDFGLARLLGISTLTRTGAVMGTVFYMSPEQAMGKRVDQRSDLYSLGTVLFEMIAGRPVFTGTSPVNVIYQLVNEPAPSLLDFVADLPPAIDDVVQRLLRKEPDARFGSASELLSLLKAILEEQPIAVERGPVVVQPEFLERGFFAPFAGRQMELDLLLAALESTLEGTGDTLIVGGPAGIGKTRLVRELALRAEERGMLALSGECLYQDAPNPYAPFTQMVTQYQEWSQTRSLSRAPSPAVADMLDQIGAILGRGETLDHVRAGWMRDARLEEAQGQLFELFVQLFRTLAEERPVLLSIDDLQWASPTALQLLHYMARAVRDCPILLVGNYRTEDVLPGPEGGSHPLRETLRRMSRQSLYREIELRPLTDEELDGLVERTLAGADIPYDLLDLLRSESEGNPFYLLELLRLLREEGRLLYEQGEWQIAEVPDRLALPQGVLDVILRRVDRVGRQDQELLEWAAVMGQRIDVEILASITGESSLRLMRSLYGLERDFGLLLSDEEGFHWEHGKIQEVVYDQLPPRLRQQTHLMIGETIEQQEDAAEDERVYDLARHFARGGDTLRGYRYTRLAAQRAQEAFAIEEAIDYCRRALALAEELPPTDRPVDELLALRHRYGRLLMTVARLDRASEALGETVALAREMEDRCTEARALLDLGILHGRRGQWEEMSLYGQRSLDLARELGDTELEALALLTMGFFDFEAGNWSQARKRQSLALEIAESAGYDLLRARILGNMAIISDASEQPERAIELYSQSLEIAQELEKPLDVGRTCNNLGFSYQGLERYDEALDCYQQGLSLFEKVGDVREQGIALLHMSETALARGELVQADALGEKAHRLFRRAGFGLGMADVDRVRAGAAQKRELWEQAERYLGAAIDVYEEHGDQLNLAEANQELADLLEHVGEVEEAREAMERSQMMYRTLHGEETDDDEAG